MVRSLYLPEYHTFAHVAIAPWPVDPRQFQRDWVESINIMELWLEQRVGPHLVEWAFSQQQEQEYWQACIAFKREKYKTLFLLTWA